MKLSRLLFLIRVAVHLRGENPGAGRLTSSSAASGEHVGQSVMVASDPFACDGCTRADE